MPDRSKDQLISEKEFIPILNEITMGFFRLLNLIGQKSPKTWPKRYYSILSEKAHNLETYLDDYNARNNKLFSYLTELFASIKWFAYSAFLQKHILVRLGRYNVDLPDAQHEEFVGVSKETLSYLDRSLLALLDELMKEAKKLKLVIPEEGPDRVTNHDPFVRNVLPQNIDDEGIVEQKHIIAEVATLYKNVAGTLKKLKVRKEFGAEEIKKQTLQDFDETKARHLESLIHNIQSKYDTYLKNTALESKHKELRMLRGYASIALHLFEMATILVHFYERHENDIRYEKTAEKLSAIIPKEDLLQVLNGQVRYYGIWIFLKGETYADEIVRRFMEIQTIRVKPKEGFALHARPLSLIAKIAMHYNTLLEIEIDEKSCNAGSIMQMILMAGNNPRPEEIIFRGEERALRDVKDLFEFGFLEFVDSDEVPARLNYLMQ